VGWAAFSLRRINIEHKRYTTYRTHGVRRAVVARANIAMRVLAM